MSFPRVLAVLVVSCGLLFPLWSPSHPRSPPHSSSTSSPANTSVSLDGRGAANSPPQTGPSTAVLSTPARPQPPAGEHPTTIPSAPPAHVVATADEQWVTRPPAVGIMPAGGGQRLDAVQWREMFHRERGVPRLVHTLRRLFPDCGSYAGEEGCSAFRQLAAPLPVSFQRFGTPEVPTFPAALEYPDFPRLHGAGFKLLCDRVLKDRTKDVRAQLLRPQQVANRSLIFLETGSEVRALLAMLPRIPNCFFLLTHNFNFPAWPARLLDSPKLLLWFSIHLGPGRIHSKLVAIPLGLPKRGANYSAQLAAAVERRRGQAPRKLLHARFRVRATNDNRRLERLHVMSALQANFPNITLEEVEKRIPSSGHGPDCYRTWESLYLGRVPVVERRLQDSLLQGIPAVVVDTWSSLTPQHLHRSWDALAKEQFNLAKLWLPWWVVHMLTLCMSVP
eukprot:GGOE01018396.1.p1 GENE.GGOE01018396.1~~GGOE01018396.1.p1  ORF type:complete len:448 (+),score=94.30 GGOE01018396.1:29-1372(+)